MNVGKHLTGYVVMALILGVATGCFVRLLDPGDANRIAAAAALVPGAFLRLIKMIVAPLVLSTLVAGVARVGDVAAIGRIGGKALAWFLGASIISLSVGLLLVTLFEPGKAMHLDVPAGSEPLRAGAGLSVETFIEHALPTSIFDALARNEILQIVVFSLFFAAALASLGDRARRLIEALDVLAHAMLRLTGYVMLFAPLAVFGAMVDTVATRGLHVIAAYGILVGEFYLGLAVLWGILLAFGLTVIGPRVFDLMRRMREPILLAFSTASSESAYPKTLQELERFGVSNRIASFMLPIGYSFNLDGSMMYCIFAVMFIAQVFGIEMSLGEQILLLAVLLLTSKGMAGVPRASLVVIAATLPQFHIPEGGIVLLLAVDHFLDMGRTATNVVGNSIATAAVAK